MATLLDSPPGETLDHFDRAGAIDRAELGYVRLVPRQRESSHGAGALALARHDPVPQSNVVTGPVAFQSEGRPWRVVPLAAVAVVLLTMLVGQANAMFTAINGDTQPLRVAAHFVTHLAASLT